MPEYGQYRIAKRGDMFEPQQSWIVRDKLLWVPLDPKGYWLHNVYDNAKVEMHISMNEEAAKKAIARAMAINGENLKLVPK